ncbi:hypothetical protein EG329_011991 [Mollisiaceae sp. DMI_Dod_QoI]|nr:hypothetical protein EG329_011991 [Helotiales sp. DMI_Dod_QoI]
MSSNDFYLKSENLDWAEETERELGTVPLPARQSESSTNSSAKVSEGQLPTQPSSQGTSPRSDEAKMAELSKLVVFDILDDSAVLFVGSSPASLAGKQNASTMEQSEHFNRLLAGMRNGTFASPENASTSTEQKQAFEKLCIGIEESALRSQAVVSSGILNTSDVHRERESPTEVVHIQFTANTQKDGPFHPHNQKDLMKWFAMYPRTGIPHQPHLRFHIPPINMPKHLLE